MSYNHAIARVQLELGADTCTFPFELNGKQFHSCVPKSTLLKVAFDEDAEDADGVVRKNEDQELSTTVEP